MSTVKKLFDLDSCRICLTTKKPLCPLFRYKLSGNYAEMLTSIADVKVSCNDGLPDKICGKCCSSLEKAFLVKTVAERSDRELRRKLEKMKVSIPTKKIAFDSLTDIKSEIGPFSVKPEPSWEMEVEVLSEDYVPPTSSDLKDIVIANTVIRKVDGNTKEKENLVESEADVTWKLPTDIKNDDNDDDYFGDFVDDDDDEDYVPLNEIKNKFKKPKLSDIKVFKDKKVKIKREKESKVSEVVQYEDDSGEKPCQLITCYPIMRNGCRGPPILLRRPKDATILKVHPNYKRKSMEHLSVPKPMKIRLPNNAKVLRKPRKIIEKQKEKMVCPICGILTFTLGNHMTTHQDKKRFTCSQCPRSFSQKANLEIHAKQHLGIKDHICEVCGSGFYSHKSLVRHNLIHKGERPYSCNQCNKRFIARCDLNRHLRIHSGYKPFKCSTCTMSFNAKHQLQNHERMHTGERPYTCEVCNVAFSYKVNLNNHVIKIHGINLKYKSVHKVTEDVLIKEHEMMPNPSLLLNVPPPAAHETVSFEQM